jgi:hypothetical protein
VQALHEAAHIEVAQYARRLGWERIDPLPSLKHPSLVRDHFYEMDIGLVAHVVTVIDPLTDYRAGHPFAPANLDAIQAELNVRFPAVRSALRRSGPVSVLHLVVTPMLGRSSAMGFTDQAADASSELLAIGLDDLDLITRIESHERLAIWRFAQAWGRLHDQSRVISFSAMDGYAIYRDHDNSFYLSDDGRPNLVTIPVGSGATLRTAQRKRIDAHSARLPDDGVFVEVARWQTDDRTPIYRPSDPRRASLHLVEITAPCWIVPAPEHDDETTASEDLAVAVAFWIWRCRDLIAPALSRLADDSLVVRVRFVTQSVDPPEHTELEPTSSWLACAPDDRGGVTLTLLDGAAARMFGPGNNAERLLAGSLVCAINDLVGLGGGRTPAEVAETLPAGPMRMLQVFRDTDDLFFVFGYTTMPRLVSSADVGLLLDQVGEIAARAAGIEEGPVPRDQRTDLLNAIVKELFSILASRLAELEPDHLLEVLTGEQEALLYLEARDRLLIPSQAACFGDDSEAVRRAIDVGRDLTTSSIANRFLIEFASAVGTSGSKPISASGYDELIALASQIVQFGLLSDAIYYDLSSSDLAILPSGRLGISREDPYHEAIDAYRQLISEHALELARTLYPRHWPGTTERPQTYDPMDLNAAFEAEFGVTTTEIAQLSGDLMELARNAPHQVAIW